MSRLVKNSYMDTLISKDIKINNYKYTKENLEKLRQFYYLQQQEIKWTKGLKQEKIDCNDFSKLLNYYLNNKDKEVKRLSEKEEQKLNELEYQMYLKKLRLNDELNNINNLSLEKRKKLVPTLRKIMQLNLKASNIEIVTLNEELPTTNRPIIFVLTHVGRDDISAFTTAIKKHYTILSGDYESLHNNLEGLITSLNGVKYFDMKSKEDRYSIAMKAEEVLKNNDNVLCSMEAAWNISPNEIVTKLFPGMIKVAIYTNAVIIPVGIERFNSKLYGVNVSKTIFDPKKYINDDFKYTHAIEDLRQLMADTKYQIYFDDRIKDRIKCKRKEIGDYNKYNEEFKKDILTGWTFDEEAINEKKYHDLEKPIYVYEYIIKKYLNDLEILKSEYKELKNEETLKKIYKTMIEILNEIRNPIYPNDIIAKLKEIYEEFLLIDKKEKVKKL